ncbi:hypothetical protein NBG4_220005 [Candidatus Sulfobium mesophilum]|uniref:Uncharacterized protein n=1 Tax=Candidatus Sulfobium mesophilum TaxID=2016548 RepID=A0A2U3QG59_9BACT|nr:hypothetical protein NBG4_220005 [Candidatus Sulfobium mesophilum]
MNCEQKKVNVLYICGYFVMSFPDLIGESMFFREFWIAACPGLASGSGLKMTAGL